LRGGRDHLRRPCWNQGVQASRESTEGEFESYIQVRPEDELPEYPQGKEIGESLKLITQLWVEDSPPDGSKGERWGVGEQMVENL